MCDPFTFLQIRDPLVERGERGLHSSALLRLVAQPASPILDAVHSGQHLLLQVIDFTLEQVFEAVRLHRAITATILLSGERKQCNLVLNAFFLTLVYLLKSLF